MSAGPKSGSRRCLGLLVRREKWTLSFFGKALFLAAVVAGLIAGLHSLYSFLGITERIPCRILVVDGWLPTWDLERAAEEYTRGSYDLVLAVRGVAPLDSVDLDRPYDDYVSDILVRHGVPRDRLHGVIFPEQARDRTFTSALAVGEWCRRRGIELKSLNLVTIGPHARRSRLLYRRALGGGVAIGVIGLPDPSYDAGHWWRSSEGVREVGFEGVAYFYVLLWSPEAPPHKIELLPTADLSPRHSPRGARLDKLFSMTLRAKMICIRQTC
jgi:hypothetical protein